MISSLFFLNDQGEVIIDMHFGKKVSRSTVKTYWSSYVAPLRFLEEAPEVVALEDVVFAHILRNRVFLLASVCEEGSALLALDELAMIARVLTAYLTEFSQATLRENFSLVYQLLEEILDFGYPLMTEVFALEELVPRPTLENKVRAMLDTPVLGSAGNRGTVGIGMRQAVGLESVPWRDPDARHTTSEILFDVVESMDYVMDSSGRVQKASVRGAVEVNCRLNGMPKVALHLLNTDLFDDVGFHRCVHLPGYTGDHSITFVPPDGKFTLLQYTCKPDAITATPPPFYITPQVSFNATGGRFNCMVGTRTGTIARGVMEPEKEIQKLVVKLMLPQHTTTMTVSNCTVGTTSFERSRGILTWTIGNLGRNTASLGGDFVLDPSSHSSNQGQHASPGSQEASREGDSGNRGGAAAPPSSLSGASATAVVQFFIANHSVSGLRVESVKILNEIGNPYKGVKYSAQAGNFIVRTA